MSMEFGNHILNQSKSVSHFEGVEKSKSNIEPIEGINANEVIKEVSSSEYEPDDPVFPLEQSPPIKINR